MKNTLSLLLLFILINTTYAQTGNVGIGTASPDASAILDISSSNKGLLIPRVSLSNSSTFGLTGATATPGMMVYNTNASIVGGYGVGFYYWSTAGGPWARIANGNLPATLSNGKIWIGDASNNPIEQTMSGDATISNTGIIDLNNQAVETSEIADNAVDGTKINITSNANGDLMYFNGTDWVRLASGTTGQLLQANGAAAPTWASRTAILNSQNGLSTVTTGGSATATTPYMELGGSLYKPTTIAQGANSLAFTTSIANGFNVDGTTLSVDGLNDRVGVGTAAPTSKFYTLSADNTSTTNIGIFMANNQTWGTAINYTGIFSVGTNTNNNLDIAAKGTGNILLGTTSGGTSSTGNVGINNNNPLQKLDVLGNISVNGNGGNSIYTWTNSDANWRIGMSNDNAVVGFSRSLATSHVQYLSYANGGGQGFAVGDKVSGLSSFEVTGAGSSYNAFFRGSVGIGGNPTHNLSIAATGSVFGVANTAYFQAKNSAGTFENYFWPRWSDNIMYMNYGSGGFNIRNNSSASIMFMTNGGNVGINNTNPTQARLVVSGISSLGNQNIGGFWYHATGYSSCFPCNVPNTGSAGGAIDISIYASNRIVATEFDATSDRRIKKDFKLSVSENDLKNLMNLKVTDFKYIDDFSNGTDYKKGFVAQEVEQVFPEAVQKHIDFIPSIYQLSTSAEYNPQTKELKVKLSKPHDFKVGDIIKTSSPKKDDIINSVVEIISPTEFILKDWADDSINSIFVYGKQIEDFRTVDYDRIYTLNVSATQELVKHFFELKDKISKMEKNNSQLNNDVQGLKASIETLQHLMGLKVEK